ncbi:MAG TPA: 50S ribosomal protein L9 [Firmicutes bacterium]|nr:50S ribosomal protein L9 [Bacillota bacterium]
MKIILRKDVANLGQAGEIKDVTPGYARNYLIPKGLAFEATPGRIKDIEMHKEFMDKRNAREIDEAKVLAEKVAGKAITIKAKAGEEGRLFGSVTSADICQALSAEGINVDKRKIELEEQIKSLGSYSVQVKFHPQVVATIDVNVEALE